MTAELDTALDTQLDTALDAAHDAALDAAVGAIGGSARAGQRHMARAVTAAMDQERHLLVQAGTGTGKSLGYLVPAVLEARRRERPVVVSTATLALQAQIVGKDLPSLVEALAPFTGRPAQFALLKGRSNYVCLHKVDGGYPDDLPSDALFSPAAVPGHPESSERLGSQVRRLREWARETTDGDRDSLPFPVSDRAWRQVSVSARECVGSTCPFFADCFAERSRAVAREVDVVVTNHALLAIDAFDRHGILPEHDVVVIDEAHELAARVTNAVTLDLSRGQVRGAATLLRGLGVESDALLDTAERLADALALISEGRVRGALPAAVADCLVMLASAARTAHSAITTDKNAADAGARTAARAALTEIIESCEEIGAPGDHDVVWLTRTEHRDSLHLAPLSVAGQLRRALLEERTAILTSATLALGADFTAVARSVGLRPVDRREEDGSAHLPGADDPDPETSPIPWTGIDVGSPFDYPRQGVLYVARHLAPPGRDGISAEAFDHLVELLESSGGGALGLFSSRRGAERAAEHVRARTGLLIGVQGESSLADLVTRFREDEDACLFGSLALWQGVDVAGRSNRLVVIDRIPFPRPDDPLLSARKEHVERQGGNGFMAVPAGHAALLLAQGAGRLVRSPKDKGMVAVLDQRLATAGYGSSLSAAMPPFWRTTDPQAALSALRRLRDSG